MKLRALVLEFGNSSPRNRDNLYSKKISQARAVLLDFIKSALVKLLSTEILISKLMRTSFFSV